MAKIDRSILSANDQSVGQFGDPDKLESSIKHLADILDDNDNETQSLKTDNTSNKGRLNELESDVANLQTEDSSNKGRITGLETDNSSNKSRISNLETDNASHKTRLSGHDSELSTQNQRINNLLNSSVQPSEVVDARGSHAVLRDRLNASDAERPTKKELSINVKFPPVPLVAAKGDGLTDDGATIQNIINHVNTNKLTRVLIPYGVYIIEQTIVVPSNITVVGNNGGGMFPGNDNLSILKLKAGANCNMFEGRDGSKFVNLQDLYLTGNKANNTLGSGVFLVDAATQECQWKLERVVVFDFAEWGLYIGNNRRAVKATNCSFLQNGKSGITSYGSDCVFDKCLIGLNVEDGIQVRNWVTKITSCDIFTNRTGIMVYAEGQHTIIQGNGIDRNKRHGVYIAAKNVSVIGGTLRTNSQEANNYYPNIQVQDVETQIIGVTFGFDGGYTNKPNFDIVVSANGKATTLANYSDGTSSVGGLINDRTKAKGLRQNYSHTSMPTSGSWTTGEYVENVGAVQELGTAGSKYLVLGWKRLTTGNTHALNVDWLECRALTGN